MTTIETRRFLLRDFEAGDAPAFAAYHADPRFVAAREAAGQEAGDPVALVELFRRWAAERPRKNHQLAAVERQTGLLVGCCGIRTADCPQGSGELGIELSADLWGRHGCALEIAVALAAFGFTTLGLDTIFGETTTHNRPAARLAAFLGAELEEQPRMHETQGPASAAKPAVWRVGRAQWQARQVAGEA